MDSDTPQAQLTRVLRAMPLFELLSDDQVVWLLGQSTPLTLPVSERLFSRGQADAGFFVLIEGVLEVISDVDGREQVVAKSAEPGSYAGATPLVDEAPIVGARMGRAGRVLRIPDAVMREMLVNGYPIAKHLLLGIQSRARNLREEEVSEWLEARGVSDPWLTGPALVSAGADLEWLEGRAALLPASALSSALRWLAAYMTALRMARDIVESTAHISELVQAVKLFTYRDQAPVQQVNLHEGLEVTLTLLRHKIGNGVRIERRYDPNLPLLHAHGGELNQVWINLLDNALQALQGSGSITIRTSHDSTGVSVEITDTGPGVPASIQGRIFDPFFTTKEVGSGSGLGLNIAHRIITRSHGGELTVHSKPGRTTFRVWLPIHP